MGLMLFVAEKESKGFIFSISKLILAAVKKEASSVRVASQAWYKPAHPAS